MSDAAPLACPFCGNPRPFVMDMGDDDWAVCCKECGTTGKIDDSSDIALTAWNLRAPSTEPELRAEIEKYKLRDRVCDSHCGADQYVAQSYYRAEAEFDLHRHDSPYEAISQLSDALWQLLNDMQNGVSVSVAAKATARIVLGNAYPGADAMEGIMTLEEAKSIIAALGGGAVGS